MVTAWCCWKAERSSRLETAPTGSWPKLGHGDEEIQYQPKVIEALRGVRVSAVSTCAGHSLVLTEAGEVLSFGYGEDKGRPRTGSCPFYRLRADIAARTLADSNWPQFGP